MEGCWARARRRVRRRRSDSAGFVASFKDLKEGDLCVHAEFGVCRYTGLVTMQVAGVGADFLLLEFAAKDKVYLPVSRMRLRPGRSQSCRARCPSLGARPSPDNKVRATLIKVHRRGR